ncbi:MAG: hypothetical protein AAB521_00410 [Patescibacteria group bacterium]
MISSGLITEIETADEGVTQFTNLRIESGIVNCPLSLIIAVPCVFIIESEYQKFRKLSIVFGSPPPRWD